MNFFEKLKHPRTLFEPQLPQEPVVDTSHFDYVSGLLRSRLSLRSEIPRIDGELDEFDFNKMIRSGKRNLPRHEIGFMREARFRDGLWIAMTSATYFSTVAHALALPDDEARQPIYVREVIESDSQSSDSGMSQYIGVEEIAHPNALSPILLGKIALTLEMERAKGYPGKLFQDEAELYRKDTLA